MKKILPLVLIITAFCIGYVWLQVKIVSFSYTMRDLLKKKEMLLCTQQYLIAKILSITSPDSVEKNLLARRVCVSYFPPKKVVRLTDTGSSGGENHSVALFGLFGMPQASADE